MNSLREPNSLLAVQSTVNSAGVFVFVAADIRLPDNAKLASTAAMDDRRVSPGARSLAIEGPVNGELQPVFWVPAPDAGKAELQ